LIGTVLDKYEILQKIGEGGMASVYRGRHVTLGRDVAIKILHPHLSSAERNRQRFAREARAIEHLHHDNILRIFDYSGAEAEDCYIVTEFVDGRTLQELLVDHGPLRSEVVAMLGMKLADALQYAHDLGIIHRDLKPENVMLRRDGTVKLMDFGIARFLDEMHLTLTGALVGSPAYMSPEQAMERVLDPRSDLFSLGTLLFHLSTGQLPFAGNNPSIVLRNIIEGRRPGVSDLAPGVSGALADLINALLQTDPGDRPRTAADVRDRLALVLDEVDIDPTDSNWALQTWLLDPDGYRERLDARLRDVLLEKGKQHLEQRDHLGALQLFNRLLSIDEDNEEVLALVQGMHSPPTSTRRAGRWWAGGLALVVVAAGLSWALWPRPQAPADSPPAHTPTPLEAADGSTASTAHPAGTTGAADGDGALERANTSGAAAPDDAAPPGATPPVEGAPAAPAGSMGADETAAGAATGQSAGQDPEPPGASAAPADADALRGSPSATAARTPAPTPRRLVALPQPRSGRAPADLPKPGSTQDDAAVPSDGSPADAAAGTASGDAPAHVSVYVPESWGHIYIDGVYEGRTGARREPISVTPGTHTLTVKNDLAFPHEERFTVAPGEVLDITTPALQRRPATVVLSDTLDASCVITLDGAELGTVSSLGGAFSLDAPDQPHAVHILCPDGAQDLTVGPLLGGESARIP